MHLQANGCLTACVLLLRAFMGFKLSVWRCIDWITPHYPALLHNTPHRITPRRVTALIGVIHLMHHFAASQQPTDDPAI